MKRLSVIIPVYNEKNTIESLVSQVIMQKIEYELEIIIVDDGSNDGTRAVLEKLSKHKNVKVIFKPINSGKGDSVKQGILNSSGDIVLIQDADLEYVPSNYPELLAPFELSKADVVYGSRLMTNRPHRVMYFWHYVINNLLTLVSNILTNLNLTDMETGYKVFKGDLIRSIASSLQSKRFGFEPEITAKIAKFRPSLRIYEIGITYDGRTYDEGKKIGWKDGVDAIYCLIKYNIFKTK